MPIVFFRTQKSEIEEVITTPSKVFDNIELNEINWC